jgi:hypothetical protein
MKKIFALVLFFFLVTGFTQAQLLRDIKNTVTGGAGFTQEEAGRAIKEALQNGVIKGVAEVSRLDGYLGNPQIRIPFPPEMQAAEKRLRKLGMNKLVDDAITSFNRAAEDAAGEARDIFVLAIRELTFRDAIEIISGKENEATSFLQRTTSDSLNARFKPIVEQSLAKVSATRHWGDVMTQYNRLPIRNKVNPDINSYVTDLAIKGLFHMVAEEEKKIRKDPVARTSDILEKVFGGSR